MNHKPEVRLWCGRLITCIFVFTLLDVRVQWHLLVGKAVIYVLCTEFTKLINLWLEFSSLEFRHCILACKQLFSLNLRGIQIIDSKDRISTLFLHQIVIFLFSIWNPLNFLFLSHWPKRHEVPLLKTKNSSSNLTLPPVFPTIFQGHDCCFCVGFSAHKGSPLVEEKRSPNSTVYRCALGVVLGARWGKEVQENTFLEERKVDSVLSELLTQQPKDA